jgi:hypothetical protein
MAAKLFSLCLLVVVGLGVVSAAPLDVRQANATCLASQNKMASGLSQMSSALNQLSAQMNLANSTAGSNSTAALASNGTADCSNALNCTSLNSTALNSTSLNSTALNCTSLNSTSLNSTSANSTAANSTAGACPPKKKKGDKKKDDKKKGDKKKKADASGNSMKSAKAHVKGAQQALSAVMSGSKNANMTQVNGNLTLAANAMNGMKANGTAISKLKSMSQSLQADAKAMGNACGST